MGGAHKFFGYTFGVGIRNKPPSKDESPVRMKDSDAINRFDVASNFYDNVPVIWPNCRKSLFVNKASTSLMTRSHTH
jgi:hypothetical protein